MFSLSGKSKNQIPCFPCAVATLFLFYKCACSSSSHTRNYKALILHFIKTLYPPNPSTVVKFFKNKKSVLGKYNIWANLWLNIQTIINLHWINSTFEKLGLNRPANSQAVIYSEFKNRSCRACLAYNYWLILDPSCQCQVPFNPILTCNCLMHFPKYQNVNLNHPKRGSTRFSDFIQVKRPQLGQISVGEILLIFSHWHGLDITKIYCSIIHNLDLLYSTGTGFSPVWIVFFILSDQWCHLSIDIPPVNSWN